MKKYIAVDFDGTLCEHRYPHIGKAKPLIIEAVQKEYRKGSKVIIWTCRSGEDLLPMIEWLGKNNVPYHWINQNPDFPDIKSPKIYADEYWDDRTVPLEQIENRMLGRW